MDRHLFAFFGTIALLLALLTATACDPSFTDYMCVRGEIALVPPPFRQ